MPNEILRLPKVIALIGMSRSWLYAEVATGRFPTPVKLGTRAIGWRRSDVEAWLTSRSSTGDA
ncbi:MAG: AlpA family phage regulatory protein [Alphaproteobacteria bacterium]|nr:AlpA family phage regulatory protein [Alphaproteobacteria bacterium]